MRRILTITIALSLSLVLAAQTRKTAAQPQRKATTTAQRKTTTAQRKPAQKGKVAQKGKTTQKKGKTQTYTNAEIKGLQSQRAAVQKKLREQEQALKANQADVKKRLADLMVINSEITERQKSIENIQKDLTQIDGDIELLNAQLSTLQQQLDDRTEKYVKSMRYMARHRTVQDKLMFIFSADNFAQMYRRLRFVRQYASYQKSQGEQLKAKQAQVTEKQAELEKVKGQKNTLLYKDKQEHAALQGKQDEQKKMVDGLQKQQKTIQNVIAEQRQKDAALNAQIDKLIAIEVEKARKRAEEEARKKAAAEAAAAKKRAEELARKKAAAEAAAKENARRIAEAKEREEKAKAEARAEQDQRRRERAEQRAREAEAQRVAAERKAEADKRRSDKEIASATTKAEEEWSVPAADRMLNGGFTANRGRLPMPVTGSYRIVSHYGQYNVEGLKGVTLDNKGINIRGTAGCNARSIYDGEVSAVINFEGSWIVMVRHGSYISVYCNLRSVNVSKGQKVSTRQILGAVGTEDILQFQLRKGTEKLNPETWLGR